MNESRSPGLLVRFRPTGPWRFGPDSGARDRVDRIGHSDTLFSAVCSAMSQLGMLEEWLSATAANGHEPAVRLSSCFPWQEDELFVVPPRNLWPPAPSAKVRWKGARFVPMSLVSSLLADKPPDEERWVLDAASGCLLPAARRFSTGPFRQAVRSAAAIDRVTQGTADLHSTACLEFVDRAGMWCAVAFSGDEAHGRWSGPVQSAFRLLADSGIGGERSRGWGRSAPPQIAEGALPDLILLRMAASSEPRSEAEVGGEVTLAPPATDTGWWLLSLFAPGPSDTVDWNRGDYQLLTRGGRVESPVRWGEEKKNLRMVCEGSVLLASTAPRGNAPNVAPDDFPHPVFRSGFAFAFPIPWRLS